LSKRGFTGKSGSVDKEKKTFSFQGSGHKEGRGKNRGEGYSGKEYSHIQEHAGSAARAERREGYLIGS